MEISGHGRAHRLADLLLGVQEVKPPAGRTSAQRHTERDHVEISAQAKEIQRIKALVNEPDTARAERLERIQQALASGTYDVRGRSVADALIRHVLTDAVL